MNIEVNERENGIVEIVLNGRLDITGSAEIETQFTFNVATKKTAVLVNMSGVTFIASIGMRLLLSNARSANKRGGKMVLYNPSDLVEDALKIAGIDQLIPIYHNEETAVNDLLAAMA